MCQNKSLDRLKGQKSERKELGGNKAMTPLMDAQKLRKIIRISLYYCIHILYYARLFLLLHLGCWFGAPSKIFFIFKVNGVSTN